MMLWFIGLPLTTFGGNHGAGIHRPDLRHHRRGPCSSARCPPAALDRRHGGFAGADDHHPAGIRRDRRRRVCVLASTPIFASNLMSKALARTDLANTIVVWQNTVIVVCAAPFAIAFWQTPLWTDLLWFMAAGLCGTLGHICQQRGHQLADITLLQPIGFMSLIWNTLLGFFLFTQQPDIWTFGAVIGAAVIFSSAVRLHREAVRRAGRSAGVTQSGRVARLHGSEMEEGVSAAGDAHVPRDRRPAVTAVDDEVVALGLARDRLT